MREGYGRTYEVRLVGKDYKPVNECGIIISMDGKTVDQIKEYSPYDLKKGIIDHFLAEVADSKGYLRDKYRKIFWDSGKNNSEDDEENQEKTQFYQPATGKYKDDRFQGVVGVIRVEDLIFDPSEDSSEKKPSDSQEETKIEDDSMNSEVDSGVENRKLRLNVTLQIQSRLDILDNDTKEDTDSDVTIGRPYFLSTMLMQGKYKLTSETVPESMDELFDFLLLFLFKEQLQRAVEKGYYKTYQRFEENNDHLRGSIDIARHIRMNMGLDNGKIAYSYRENTIKNYMNQLIVVAYDRLRKKYSELTSQVFDNTEDDFDVKSVIDFLKIELSEGQFNVRKIVSKNTRPIAHPYYTEYEKLRRTCLKILRDEGTSFFDGTSEDDVKGMLFYLPELWELFLQDNLFMYVIDQINSNQEDEELSLQVQGMSDPGKNDNAIKVFGYSNKPGFGCKQETKPDYVLLSKNRPFMVLDAKFKPAWKDRCFDKEKLNSKEELLPDYDKCLRDMVSINANATGVVFPVHDKEMKKMGEVGIIGHPISCYNQKDYFYTLPIRVPVVEKEMSYYAWKKEFDECMKKGAKLLQEIIASEIKICQKRNEIWQQGIEKLKNGNNEPPEKSIYSERILKYNFETREIEKLGITETSPTWGV